MRKHEEAWAPPVPDSPKLAAWVAAELAQAVILPRSCGAGLSKVRPRYTTIQKCKEIVAQNDSIKCLNIGRLCCAWILMEKRNHFKLSNIINQLFFWGANMFQTSPDQLHVIGMCARFLGSGVNPRSMAANSTLRTLSDLHPFKASL